MTIIANMVWPALYVSAKLGQLQFLVFITVILEALLIYFFLKFTILKSAHISLVINLFSAFVGTYILIFTMLGYHLFADRILGNTFNSFNWIATYVLMCTGSIIIEILIARGLWKIKLKDSYLPLMIGNLLTYIITAIVNINVQI